MKLHNGIIAILIFFNIVISFYVTVASESDNYICDTGAGCDVVKNSVYSSIFGIKLSLFGVICFSLLLLSYYLFRDRYYYLFFSFTVLGSIFSLYFIYLQLFVIGAICSNCMIIDIVAILIFLISAYDIHARTKSKKNEN